MITLPVNITLQDWANQAILDLDKYGPWSRLMNDNWKDWASQFLNNTDIGGSLPNPYYFDEWRDWADRFCQSIY
jgi:hypothetical protein